MASMVSKLARAAFATRAFPLAAAGTGSRPAAAIRVFPAGGPKTEEDDDARPIGPKARLYVDENALKSDEAMWAFYERWCEFHGISRTRREMELRFKGFSEGARAIYNASRVGVPKGMNIFADLSSKEASRRFGIRVLGTRRK